MADTESNLFVPASEQLGEFKRNGLMLQRHYTTGITGVDDVLGGGLYPGIAVLGAIPGMGKSTLALQIAAAVAKHGTPVLFYSLEMPGDRVASKLLNREIHLMHPESKITSDWLLREESHINGSDSDWDLVAEAQASLNESYDKLYIRDCSALAFSAASLAADAMRFVERMHERPTVFVDYLQYLAPEDNRGFLSDKQRTDASVKELKSLALKLRMPVVAISSLNRDSYAKSLRLDSFKETGGIEYTASVVFGLQFRNIGGDREEELGKEPRELELTCLKQRYGRAGASSAVALDFYPARDLFEEKGAAAEEGEAEEKSSSGGKVVARATSTKKKATGARSTKKTPDDAKKDTSDTSPDTKAEDRPKARSKDSSLLAKYLSKTEQKG